MSDPYTPFPAKFPGFALVDALSVIKDGAVKTPAGQLQLAHAGWELAGWGFGATLGADRGMFGTIVNATPLTDGQAIKLLEETALNDGDSDGAKMATLCPISPTTALKLAGWLLKVAEIVLPIVL